MMLSVDHFRNLLLVYILAGAVGAVSANLPRQQDPGGQTTTGQPYTTAVAGEPPSTGTSTNTAASPTGTIAVEPLDGEHTGDGTFYHPGKGACGHINTDADLVVAVSHLLFDYFPGSTTSNPNTNPICGKKLVAHYLDPHTQQKTSTPQVTIVDRCADCKIRWSVDFSPTAFNALASQALGRVNITWSFVDQIDGETLPVPNTAAAVAAAAKREIPRKVPRTDLFDFKKRVRQLRSMGIPLDVS